MFSFKMRYFPAFYVVVKWPPQRFFIIPCVLGHPDYFMFLLQMTLAPSYTSYTSSNGSVVRASSSDIANMDLRPGVNLSPRSSLLENPDLLRQLAGASSKGSMGDDIRLAMLNNSSKVAITSNETFVQLEQMEAQLKSPPALPRRSTSYDILRKPSSSSAEVLATSQHQKKSTATTSHKLSPPTPFADDSFVADTLPHLMAKQPPAHSEARFSFVMSKTLPRRLHTPQQQLTRNSRKSLTEAIPPPPQYKGVHFDPHIEERRRSADDEDLIPVEGLPTRPAMPKQTIQGETVAIQVRKANPVPLLTSVKANGPPTSSSTFESVNKGCSSSKKPVPPPKTSTLSNNSVAAKAVMGVRDKALAASAAGCEIVFVSPDEGFNEDSVATVVNGDLAGHKN
jgi:hypothetical protein